MESLETPQETVKSSHKVKLSWFNVANAKNDEDSREHRYSQREDGIHDAIKKSQSDVCCILELRVCSDINKTRKLMPEELATRLSKNTNLNIAALRPQNLDHMAFWRATFYNNESVTPLQTFCKWAIPPVFGSTLVSERGVMLIFTQFKTPAWTWLGEYAKGNDHKTFWVVNSHMPMALDEKLRVIQYMNDNAVNHCIEAGDTEPLIFYGGDQNTFFDEGGQEMMDLFAEKWDHLSTEASPTFHSFPHDKFQATSTLDHIFVNKGMEHRYKKVGLATATDTGASDHFLMSVEIELL